jgi:Flp pilus assembly protein TadG
MNRRRGTGRAGSRAQALVEFALVAPLFFLLIFAVIDFGRYVYYVQILNNAAREGARYAIVHGSNSLNPTGPTSSDPSGNAVKSVVRSYAVGVIGDSTVLVVNPSWNPTSLNTRGTRVTVQVTYPFHSVIPVVPLPPVTINGESTLVINN